VEEEETAEAYDMMEGEGEEAQDSNLYQDHNASPPTSPVARAGGAFKMLLDPEESGITLRQKKGAERRKIKKTEKLDMKRGVQRFGPEGQLPSLLEEVCQNFQSDLEQANTFLGEYQDPDFVDPDL
jgi:hypothetical protein